MAGLAVGVALLVAGVVLFAIGANGTFSVVQTVIGIFLAAVGAIAILAAIRSQ